jgi:hypothetical protein
MKQSDYTKQLAQGLHGNTQLKRLTLSKLNLTDQSVILIAEALKINKTLVFLDVSNNKFGNTGLIALAEALKDNNTIIELSVIGQSQPFGDLALQKMTEMFEFNINLQKINWRLHSRQSFALNKLISRNVDINRRMAAGQKLEDYINTVPGPRKPDFGLPKDYIWVEGGPAPPVNKDGKPEDPLKEEEKDSGPEEIHHSPEIIRSPSPPEDKHSEEKPERVSEEKPQRVPEEKPERVSEEKPQRVSEEKPQKFSEEKDVTQNDDD